jgi:putative SOS response-associated peptidase YedK
MCGRFALTVTPAELAELFSIIDVEDFPPRYNIAPTQPILIVMAGQTPEKGSNASGRNSMLVRWGLIPSWVKDPNDFPLLINARSETAVEKASFRAAMRHKRILIPVSGFYEWHRPPKESGEKSQAWWVRPKNGGLMAIAGLMETWASADGSEVDTAAILTTCANAAFAPIHDRLPVVIAPQDFDRWLDCKTQEPRQVVDLMVPAQNDYFECIPVSDLVNKVKNVGPELQVPVDRAKPQTGMKKATSGGGQMDLF